MEIHWNHLRIRGQKGQILILCQISNYKTEVKAGSSLNGVSLIALIVQGSTPVVVSNCVQRGIILYTHTYRIFRLKDNLREPRIQK